MATNNSSFVNTTTVVLTTTTARRRIYDGEIFEATEHAAMKISIWPLIFIIIFAILGFVGNSIVIYIYWTKWKKNKTRIFILTLGVLDWINCVFNMPVEMVVLLHPISFDMHYLCKISRGCTYVINNTGSLVLVSIAIERYILVYYPLKNRSLTPKFAKGMCVLAFIIALIFSWPSFVFYGSHTFTIQVAEGVEVVGKTCLIADEHKPKTDLLLTFTTVLLTLLVLIFVILSVLYIAIGKKIYITSCTDLAPNETQNASRFFSKSIISALTGSTKPTETKRLSRQSCTLNGNNKTRSSLTFEDQTLPNITRKADRGDTKLTLPYSSETVASNFRKFSTVNRKATRKNTVMMRMVTIAFMISFTPFLCILIIRYTNSNYYLELNDTGKIFYKVFKQTYFINSMVNPFIYGFMNLHFRNLVKDLLVNIFCSKCCRRENGAFAS